MELFWTDIRQMDEAAYAAALGQMSRERQKVVCAIEPADERKRTVAADALARRVIREKLGDAAVVSDENGILTVQGNALYVSVSFSGAWSVCAVDDKPLAVAIEVIRSAQEKFIHRMCSEAELSYIRYGDAGCFHRFWECWTAKEALFSLTGKGPLLALSRFALPAQTALTLTMENGCAVTVATTLL